MKKITLYRVTRSDAGIDITPNKPNSDNYTETYRLIADEGKVLTDGRNYYGCIDTDEPDKFTEVNEFNETSSDPDEATTEDLYEALAKLGVS